jgi:hypothetical protein
MGVSRQCLYNINAPKKNGTANNTGDKHGLRSRSLAAHRRRTGRYHSFAELPPGAGALWRHHRSGRQRWRHDEEICAGGQEPPPGRKNHRAERRSRIPGGYLAPGLHLGLWPWQFTVELVKFFTVAPCKVGCVEACDGAPLPSGRIVAQVVACDSFQDARAFLQNGGERGSQMGVIPPGTYRINSLLFSVTLNDAIVVPPGMIGVISKRATAKPCAAAPAAALSWMYCSPT